jgi:uncharacterized protein involved in outer membrane biogenesis
MKKIIVRTVMGVVILAILVFVAIGFFMDGAIKKGVETVGPRLTKTDVKLGEASLSLLSGSGRLTGLVVGNPEGYKTASAISVGQASLAVSPGSLFSDKIVVKSINVQAPEVTFETDLKGNNLSKLLANLQETTGGGAKEPAPAKEDKTASKKLQVNEFVIAGGKVNVSVTALGGTSATVPLPEIRLADLGTGPEGITVAELSQRVLRIVLEKAAEAAASSVTDLSKQIPNLTKDLDKAAAGATEKVTKGLGDLLKTKK